MEQKEQSDLARAAERRAAEVIDSILREKQRESNNTSINPQNKNTMDNQEMKQEAERLIYGVTINDVRNVLDDMNYRSRLISERNQLVVTLAADEDCPRDMIIVFSVEGKNNDWIKSFAFADDHTVDVQSGSVMGHTLYLLNDYNQGTRYSKAYLQEDTIYIERHDFADRVVSYKWLSETVNLSIRIAWRFFCDRLFTAENASWTGVPVAKKSE